MFSSSPSQAGRMRVRPVRIAASIAAALTFGVTLAGWCDLVFKDVVPLAASVVVAEYHGSAAGGTPRFTVESVFKGACTDEQLDLDLEELEPFELRDGDRLLLALNSYFQPIRATLELGGCIPVSILPIRGGKLRSHERSDYDYGHKSLTLEQLGADIKALVRQGS